MKMVDLDKRLKKLENAKLEERIKKLEEWREKQKQTAEEFLKKIEKLKKIPDRRRTRWS